MPDERQAVRLLLIFAERMQYGIVFSFYVAVCAVFAVQRLALRLPKHSCQPSI